MNVLRWKNSVALEKLGKPATVENINPYRRSDVSYQRTELANAFSRDYNETSGNVGLRKVVRTFVKEADELIHVTIKGKETVCTNEHPFYSPVKGWTAACKLRAGDILVTVNGEYVVVEKIQHEILESPVKVYNFEVEGYHTYYVGDEGVLVHNECKRLGGGHGRDIHKERIDRFIEALEKSDNYTEIYGNRALKTAGLVGSQRPDVIALGKDGIYHIWEFASKSQASGVGLAVLKLKMKIMQKNNPLAIVEELIPWN